jgi:two-component system chemotaxis response regulator CheB
VLPGHIYIAPGGQHLEVARVDGGVVTRLSDAAPENSCRPSADVLFRSAVEAWSGRVMVLLLTGMGHDGLAGARFARAKGATVIAQDEATSVVWGMPGAVVQAGLADAVVPLGELPAALLRLGGGSGA